MLFSHLSSQPSIKQPLWQKTATFGNTGSHGWLNLTLLLAMFYEAKITQPLFLFKTCGKIEFCHFKGDGGTFKTPTLGTFPFRGLLASLSHYLINKLYRKYWFCSFLSQIVAWNHKTWHKMATVSNQLIKQIA